MNLLTMLNQAFRKLKLCPSYFRIAMLLSFLITISSNMNIGYATTENPEDAASENGQPSPISGTVTDENGEALPGVNILIEGTTTGIITDIDGNFTIQAGKEDVLIFSFLGFNDERIQVGDQTNITIMLVPDILSIEEVVISVGYGKVKKSDLTGSVSSIKSDDVVATPVATLDHALQGRASGVFVSNNSAQPGAESSIRIRGVNSVMGNNDPLYVIDGYVGGDINTIPAADIKSIEILKDASSTAIYGARGANGVVIISTKSGEQGKNTISFNAYYGWQKVPEDGIDLMSGPQFAHFVDSVWSVRGAPLRPFPEADSVDSYDWLDEMFDVAPMQNYSLSSSGGTEKVNYYISGNYVQKDGVTRNSYYERFNFRANVDVKVNDWLNVGARLGYSDADRSRNLEENMERSGSGNPVATAIRMDPTLSPYDEEGELVPTITPYSGIITGNPLYIQEYRTDFVVEKNTTGNAYAEISILPGLTLKSTFGFEQKNSKNNIYKPNHVYDGLTNWQSYGEVLQSTRYTWLNENFVTYNVEFGSSNLTLMGGFSINESNYERAKMSGRDFTLDEFSYHAMQEATSDIRINTSEERYARTSLFARVNYNYKNRYLLTFTGRRDGSSRFGQNNKYGFFPSGAIAWRVTQEEFMQNISLLNSLKLRASYGISGSEAISPYESLSTLQPSDKAYYINQQVVNGYFLSNMGNPYLSWEETAQLDIGFDASFLKNQLNVVFDYFDKTTSDLFLEKPVPMTTAFTQQLMNVGEIRNNGIELAVNWLVLKTNDFTWTIDANFTWQKSEIMKLTGSADSTGTETILRGQIRSFQGVQILQEGQSLGAYYGFETDGLWIDTVNAYTQFGRPVAPGDIKIVDRNGDGNISDADRTIIGKEQPTYFGGLNTTLAWKGIDLSFFFHYVIAVDVFNLSNYDATNMGDFNNKTTDVIDNYFIAPTDGHQGNTGAYYPRLDYTTPTYLLDRYVENASFLRLREITLGYTVPSKILSKIHVNNLRIYTTVSNLWVLTNYKGFDPEVNVQGTDPNAYAAGRLAVDSGGYPRAKSIIIGLSMNF